MLGTSNKTELFLGYGTIHGDLASAINPIGDLYKTQVYALSRALGLPEEICASVPTTDTYSLEQGQDEFYFVLPYAEMDLLLWGHNHGVDPAEAAPVLDLTPEQVARVYHDIERKRATTRPLQLPPLLVKDVPEDKHQDLDFIIEQLDWEKNVDPSFKDNHFLAPIVANQGDGWVDRWIVYGLVDGKQLFSARDVVWESGDPLPFLLMTLFAIPTRVRCQTILPQ